MPIVLYDIAGSAPCTFVRMLAKLEGIELHLKLVDLLKGEQHSSAYLKVSYDVLNASIRYSGVTT